MTDRTKKAVEAVRASLHDHGRALDSAEWRDLLEDISAECEGYLDALDEEEGKG